MHSARGVVGGKAIAVSKSKSQTRGGLAGRGLVVESDQGIHSTMKFPPNASCIQFQQMSGGDATDARDEQPFYHAKTPAPYVIISSCPTDLGNVTHLKALHYDV